MTFIFGAPQYYVQGEGVLADTAKHLAEIGVNGNVLIIQDPATFGCSVSLRNSLTQSSISFELMEFEGSISLDAVEKFVGKVEEHSYDCIIGIGGGKTIDFAKRIAWAVSARIVTVPTSIASDAATSRSAVSHGNKGEIVEDLSISCPSLVLVDSRVIVNAPIRLFSAGMADAISKRYEYVLSQKCGAGNWFNANPVYFIDNVSLVMHSFLFREARYLKKCFTEHILNETVEQGITSMLLMSRIVYDSGGLRGAHDMFEVFHDMGYGRDYLHGEIVGFFDLVHLKLEDYAENEFYELYQLYDELGIPLSISKLGFPVKNDDALTELIQQLIIKVAKFNYYPKPDDIRRVILGLEDRIF
jgi:glycerol dehydrogenase